MGWEWSYCTAQGCEHGLARATSLEVIRGQQYCADGHLNEPNRTKDDLIEELFDRVEALENKS